MAGGINNQILNLSGGFPEEGSPPPSSPPDIFFPGIPLTRALQYLGYIRAVSGPYLAN
jgi:hypothetical protein